MRVFSTPARSNTVGHLVLRRLLELRSEHFDDGLDAD